MSTGYFNPPEEPLPPYVVEEGTACRTCSRLKIEVLQENPHPRLYLYCDFEDRKSMPRRSCEFYAREPGTD
ncbi:hypothetical protein C3Z06_23945 [Cupriavidus metallidurans]|nr:hypothetical protein C3Z06_23945 [Cupriavidus metallidurans]